ncbi:hypothetical protein EDB92DRAFT_1900800 [Lactarius akahatsu]|uniref:Uncharacterized protein n=1 Tax=Lactarius akahatsu TaxID=416441 RepID=A0AAD4LBP4_9AGAM|nr:hypothetical protein EDB92DRAFT_1900800 [Lactarius akahatsu]
MFSQAGPLEVMHRHSTSVHRHPYPVYQIYRGNESSRDHHGTHIKPKAPKRRGSVSPFFRPPAPFEQSLTVQHGPGGQWDNPMSKGSQDTTSSRGEDTYSQQQLGQSGYEYGSNVGGGQTGTGTGSTDTQSDQYETSGQYGGSERATTGQTAGYTDPARNVAGAGGGRRPDDDDEYGAAVGPGGGPTGKPSMASKAMGTSSVLSVGTPN